MIRPTHRIADPEDQGAVIARAVQLARIGQADLSPLASIASWQRAPAPVQDIVAREVAARLGAAWEFKEMRFWSLKKAIRVPVADIARKAGAHEFGAILRLMGMADQTMEIETGCRLAIFVHRATGMEFSLCPGQLCNKRHESTCVDPFVRPLLVARWPVTRLQWYRVTEISDGRGGGRTAIDPPADHDHDPMTGVSFEAAGKVDAVGLRLTTASEWEHAARAGTTTRFYWGEEMDDEHCWHAGNSAPRWPDGSPQLPDSISDRGRPRPHAPAEHDRAGKFNAFGLVDVFGNVAEWCADGDARGGSFHSDSTSIGVNFTGYRTEHDFGGAPGLGSVGFRPICSIPGIGEAT